MVNDTIKLIEDNTDLSTCPKILSEFFIEKNKRYPSFKEAISLLDEYTMHYRTVVPYYCESVLEIFKDEEFSEQKMISKPISVEE